MARARMGLLITSLFATLAATPTPASIDPTIVAAVVSNAQGLAAAFRPRSWQLEDGKRACLLRDNMEARGRIQFIRETGHTSMWIAPVADNLPANPLGNQAYQLYFVPLDRDPKTLVATEIGAALWQEPLTNSTAPGMAVNIDPAALMKKYPAGVGIVLAQGERTIFADILRPEVAAALPDLYACRGGR